MNERIRELAEQAKAFIVEPEHASIAGVYEVSFDKYADLEKFAKLLIEETLTQVAERAYYTGDRDWSDEIDRPWVQLEFGYGELHDAKYHKGKWVKK